jgi:hypothetical protein
MKKVEIKRESTNVPTAKLRMKILKHVIKYDVYPPNWFYVNDLEKSYINDEITGEEYDATIEKLILDYK